MAGAASLASFHHDLIGRMQATINALAAKLGDAATQVIQNQWMASDAEVPPWLDDKDVLSPLLTAYDARIQVR
ncbi:MAG: hypothetical protein EOO41_04090 [Methanobacteriota archaeon]|nr:MAG: hypothetical protein EOO41_04090 [Euryarchaeota archaeon]